MRMEKCLRKAVEEQGRRLEQLLPGVQEAGFARRDSGQRRISERTVTRMLVAGRKAGPPLRSPQTERRTRKGDVALAGPPEVRWFAPKERRMGMEGWQARRA